MAEVSGTNPRKRSRTESPKGAGAGMPGPGTDPRGGALTSIGMRIRALRQEAGWTQAELGTPEFSKAYISQIESCRVTPSLATLSVIAAKLGTTIDALLPQQADEGQRLQDLERLWRAAERLAEHGEKATAVDLVEQAARLSAVCRDPKLRGEGHLRYAIALFESGQTQAALDECEEAIEAFSGAGDTQLLGRAYNMAGLIYRDLGEWAASRRYFLRALRIFPRRVVWHSRVLNNLAMLLARFGNYREAADYARRAIVLTHTYGDGDLEAKTHISLSYTLIEAGDPRRAIQELDEAERLLASLGSPSREKLIRRCHHNRIIAQHRLGIASAAQELRAWLAEVEAAGDGEVASGLYAELCRTALAEERFHDAADLAAQGIAHARAVRERQEEARLLALAATANVSAGDMDGGARALLEARELYTELHLEPALQITINRLNGLEPSPTGLLKILLETPLRNAHSI